MQTKKVTVHWPNKDTDFKKLNVNGAATRFGLRVIEDELAKGIFRVTNDGGVDLSIDMKRFGYGTVPTVWSEGDMSIFRAPVTDNINGSNAFSLPGVIEYTLSPDKGFIDICYGLLKSVRGYVDMVNPTLNMPIVDFYTLITNGCDMETVISTRDELVRLRVKVFDVVGPKGRAFDYITISTIYNLLTPVGIYLSTLINQLDEFIETGGNTYQPIVVVKDCKITEDPVTSMSRPLTMLPPYAAYYTDLVCSVISGMFPEQSSFRAIVGSWWLIWSDKIKDFGKVWQTYEPIKYIDSVTSTYSLGLHMTAIGLKNNPSFLYPQHEGWECHMFNSKESALMQLLTATPIISLTKGTDITKHLVLGSGGYYRLK